MPARAERLAPHNPPNRIARTNNRAMRSNCLNRVLRTGRPKTTIVAQKGRDKQLVCPNEGH